jgi:hypothetical protein
MKVQDMTQRYRKFKRSWGMWYAFDTVTGNSVSLKTRVSAEAVQKVNAMNETERQPCLGNCGSNLPARAEPDEQNEFKPA